MSTTPHYNVQTAAAALRKVGLGRDDVVMTHIGIGLLGYPEEGRSAAAACDTLARAFREVIGAGGTWLVPAYSYSYCKDAKTFDLERTPSDLGEFSNYFLKQPCVLRSRDPIFSVAASGPQAAELIGGLPRDCFGSDSVYGRLHRVSAKLCAVGTGFKSLTFAHYAEQANRVPYRFKKKFCGTTLVGGAMTEEEWEYNVRVLADNTHTNLSRLEILSREAGALRAAPLGLSDAVCITARDFFDLASAYIAKDPWFLAKGPVTELEHLKK